MSQNDFSGKNILITSDNIKKRMWKKNFRYMKNSAILGVTLKTFLITSDNIKERMWKKNFRYMKNIVILELTLKAFSYSLN